MLKLLLAFSISFTVLITANIATGNDECESALGNASVLGHELRSAVWLAGGLDKLDKVSEIGLYSVVYRLEHEGKLYALKVPRRISYNTFVLEEYNQLRGLKHTNIVRASAVFALESRVVLALPYLGDTSMRTYLKEVKNKRI